MIYELCTYIREDIVNESILRINDCAEIGKFYAAVTFPLLISNNRFENVAADRYCSI